MYIQVLPAHAERMSNWMWRGETMTYVQVREGTLIWEVVFFC